MKIKLIGSARGSGPQYQYLISYLINDRIAIDAGCIGLMTPLAAQKRITDIVLSHAHIDHVASLPLLIDNVYQPGPSCPTVWGSAATLRSLRADLFNDRIWPDVIRLSESEAPFVQLSEFKANQTISLGPISITAVELQHVVPTFGFVVEDEEGAVAFVSDTAPTDAIWKKLNDTDNLRAVFLEASFPNSMAWLAEKSMHLTPGLFAVELQKLNHDVPIVVVHVKAEFHDLVLSELKALQLSNLQVGEVDHEYRF